MPSTVGKINGQVLENNLLRNGVDLAFDTDLIYLDVNSGRIGINTDTPFRPLLVNGTLSSTDVLVYSWRHNNRWYIYRCQRH